METHLKEMLEKVAKAHEVAEAYFASHEVSADILREYKGKVAQYENMYASIEMMKEEVKTPEAVEGLINQQIHILELRQQFETDIIQES